MLATRIYGRSGLQITISIRCYDGIRLACFFVAKQTSDDRIVSLGTISQMRMLRNISKFTMNRRI